MALKDGIRIIIEDVVEPEPNKEGCLEKLGGCLFAIVLIIGLLVLLFKFFMSHPIIMFIGIVAIIYFSIKVGKN
ncbi:Uncharacterised protein [Enterococcus hirae]|uniref:histidine kinase n=1 Tax=Enterococcus hirae TaxID=1354 RepID=UPI00102690E1|nr:histidine kinase [Enterococcus hirae]VFA57524.1 Uncharacterised protein [Enterococcus hirae]VTS66968.1 Uncharacterised protein [Enterococcus hirae]